MDRSSARPHSIKWGAVQWIHEQRRRQETASHTRRQPWDIQALRLVCDFLSDVWQYRNDEAQGRTLQEEIQRNWAVVELQVQQLYQRNPSLLPHYPSVHSTPLATWLLKSTVHLQMCIRQVIQQKRITILAREKAQMAGNSLLPYLVPRSEISRRRHECSAVGMQLHCRAAGLIGRFTRRFLRHRSMVEMPLAGIGDPV